MNIVVVNFNYRVGPYGFLASREVLAGGSVNNGLKDQRKALEWLQKYISRVSHKSRSTIPLVYYVSFGLQNRNFTHVFVRGTRSRVGLKKDPFLSKFRSLARAHWS